MRIVRPGMSRFDKDGDFALSYITNVTIQNIGTSTINFGFGDGVTLTLEPGMQVNYHAEDGYDEGTRIKFSFHKQINTQFNAIHFTYNKLSGGSANYAKVSEKFKKIL